MKKEHVDWLQKLSDANDVDEVATLWDKKVRPEGLLAGIESAGVEAAQVEKLTTLLNEIACCVELSRYEGSLGAKDLIDDVVGLSLGSAQ